MEKFGPAFYLGGEWRAEKRATSLSLYLTQPEWLLVDTRHSCNLFNQSNNPDHA